MSDSIEQKKKQVEMHTDFFDAVDKAIENGFYLEAIFREYAAIESRLEVLLGVLGSPCGKKVLTDNQRKDVMVSHRVSCVERIYKSNYDIGNAKLDKKFFNKLKEWINRRNQYVHGLYKGEMKYKERCVDSKKLAVDGREIARLLYNEAKRLRRYVSNHTECNFGLKTCYSDSCKFKTVCEEESK